MLLSFLALSTSLTRQSSGRARQKSVLYRALSWVFLAQACQETSEQEPKKEWPRSAQEPSGSPNLPRPSTAPGRPGCKKTRRTQAGRGASCPPSTELVDLVGSRRVTHGTAEPAGSLVHNGDSQPAGSSSPARKPAEAYTEA